MSSAALVQEITTLKAVGEALPGLGEGGGPEGGNMTIFQETL